MLWRHTREWGYGCTYCDTRIYVEMSGGGQLEDSDPLSPEKGPLSTHQAGGYLTASLPHSGQFCEESTSCPAAPARSLPHVRAHFVKVHLTDQVTTFSITFRIIRCLHFLCIDASQFHVAVSFLFSASNAAVVIPVCVRLASPLLLISNFWAVSLHQCSSKINPRLYSKRLQLISQVLSFGCEPFRVPNELYAMHRYQSHCCRFIPRICPL